MLRTCSGWVWQGIATTVVATGGAFGCAGGAQTGFYEDSQVFADAGNRSVGATGPCAGLECQRVSCPDGADTRLSGFVYTPSWVAADPVYNAVVYVPNAPVEPFSQGVSCDVCGAATSGSPIAADLTGSDGHFLLRNVPAGTDIPIVVQVGRWRQQFRMPVVRACQDNAIPPALTHLPANHMAGDIPRIAIATGAVDPLECLLLKIGIDPAEFTTPDQGGRIHVYRSNGSAMSAPTPSGSDLWSSLDTLKQYDMVLLPCEGQPFAKPVPAMQNLIDYTSAGGRVFTTHYGYVWIEWAPPPFPSTAVWAPDQADFPDPLTVDVNTSFPKGAALADWLFRLGGSPAMAQIPINEPRRDTLGTTDPALPWLTSAAPNTSVQEYTFNTPVGRPPAQQCGRVSFSDFHVNNDGLMSTATSTFPVECDMENAELTAQEKVLEFMLFDLASCIQDETRPPSVPK